MGASNWAKCPRCLKERAEAKARAEEAAEQAYGQVGPAEYERLRFAANAPVSVEDTLREDWEIGIWQDTFRVNYGATCEVCGFTFTYRHEDECTFAVAADGAE